MGDIADYLEEQYFNSIFDYSEFSVVEDEEDFLTKKKPKKRKIKQSKDYGYWIDGNGVKWRIRNMTTDHLFRCLKFAKSNKYNKIVEELRSRFYLI